MNQTKDYNYYQSSRFVFLLCTIFLFYFVFNLILSLFILAFSFVLEVFDLAAYWLFNCRDPPSSFWWGSKFFFYHKILDAFRILYSQYWNWKGPDSFSHHPQVLKEHYYYNYVIIKKTKEESFEVQPFISNNLLDEQ